jgi:hypothetical protein
MLIQYFGSGASVWLDPADSEDDEGGPFFFTAVLAARTDNKQLCIFCFTDDLDTRVIRIPVKDVEISQMKPFVLLVHRTDGRDVSLSSLVPGRILDITDDVRSEQLDILQTEDFEGFV